MGDSIKLVLRLKYKAENTKGWTYSECLRRKNKLQADFCLLMQDVISKFKVKFQPIILTGPVLKVGKECHRPGPTIVWGPKKEINYDQLNKN